MVTQAKQQFRFWRFQDICFAYFQKLPTIIMANDTSTTIDLIDDYLSFKGYNHLSSDFQAAVAESEQNGETEDRGR